VLTRGFRPRVKARYGGVPDWMFLVQTTPPRAPEIVSFSRSLTAARSSRSRYRRTVRRLPRGRSASRAGRSTKIVGSTTWSAPAGRLLVPSPPAPGCRAAFGFPQSPCIRDLAVLAALVRDRCWCPPSSDRPRALSGRLATRLLNSYPDRSLDQQPVARDAVCRWRRRCRDRALCRRPRPVASSTRCSSTCCRPTPSETRFRALAACA